MGSVIGTIKDALDAPLIREGRGILKNGVGILKIKCFRPFPSGQIVKILKSSKHIAVIDKSISLGQIGPLASDIRAPCQGKIKANVNSFVVGRGGLDITKEKIKKKIKQAGKKSDKAQFIGK